MLKNIIMTLAFLALALLITFSIQSTKNSSGKSSWLPCHKGVVVFEKVYEQELLKDTRESLKQQNYKVDSSIRKAHYMKSQLFKYVDIRKVDQHVTEAIADYQSETKKDTDTVQFKYHIYENDKNDPGKKTQKSKLYAGYLKFELFYKKKRVYAIQIDFMDMQGKDISKRVKCAIETIMTEAS